MYPESVVDLAERQGEPYYQCRCNFAPVPGRAFPPAHGLRGYHADVLAASRLRDVGLDNPSRPCAFVTVLQRVG